MSNTFRLADAAVTKNIITVIIYVSACFYDVRQLC